MTFLAKAALVAAVLVALASGAPAQQRREAGAHAHGHGKLDIVIDGDTSLPEGGSDEVTLYRSATAESGSWVRQDTLDLSTGNAGPHDVYNYVSSASGEILATVAVQGVDRHGDPVRLVGTGLLARCFQHEVAPRRDRLRRPAVATRAVAAARGGPAAGLSDARAAVSGRPGAMR